jgi:hypothetical protein
VFAALADPAGVAAHRPGALERAHLALGDWRDIRARLTDTETRMGAVLEDLGLAELVTDRRADRDRGRGDLGRDRRPGPVRHTAGPGRWIHVVVTRRIPWDPAIAAGTSPARRTRAA